ncbi:TetR/AcrR family transcriptional regulator [Spirosoma endophyticum]|uniref:Transcriptional regulator, TetR family n=1 Tax=Spirosoma endophyticum TaxID=662367 RepID=A0A1I2I5R7_9BACT|nr:TetR/AcrR family transcriptional regulator [Spirosoma endophyticum]SFF36236.1 transcriptional regulator, TetR family [Spirosoma endophyticum]
MEKLQRNRADTTQRIVDALEQLLAQKGLPGVGISAIAEKANVSKVLIYRYFGSLEGLLEYYVKMGRIVPHYDPAWLDQIQPTSPAALAPIWSGQALQLFRRMRASRASRELLKAAVTEKEPLAETISTSLDAELTRLTQQLAFLEGGDHQAISAVMLGALSFLTIQAQNDRTMMGIDLRSEAGWSRIEEAVKGIYKALAKLALDSPSIRLTLKADQAMVSTW